MNKYFAEIGMNHLGDQKLCLKMINQAILAGVDGITLQIFPQNYYDKSKPFRRELKKSFYEKITKYLNKKKIIFGLAVSDSDVVKKFSKLNINFWKILSFEFYNDKLIYETLKTNKKVYLSTGIASINDIKKKNKKFKKLNFMHTTLSSKVKDANILAIEKIKKSIKKKNFFYFTFKRG